MTSSRIAKADELFHFLEHGVVSLPVDAGMPVAGSGPLSGMTIGIKANIATEGHAWTAGIGSRSGAIASRDATVVARLRAAGAKILGRLAMDEGALGAATDNPHFGRCENPAVPGHSAGGSSGGAAAAVAAGVVDAALGSDTMGSVRIPAAYCGVFGLKLGPKTVPMDGVFPLAPSLDSLGVLARDPETVGMVLDTLGAKDQTGIPITTWAAPDPASLIGCSADTVAWFCELTERVRDCLGVPSPMRKCDLPRLRKDAFLITEVEAVRSLGSEHALSPALARLLAYGRGVSQEKQRTAYDRMAHDSATLRAALGTQGILILPTVAQPAFAHGETPPAGQADYTALANVAGLPALAIPAPTNPPVSVQIIGPEGSEHALLALARTLVAR